MKVSERVRRQVKLSKVLHFSLCSVFKCINKVHTNLRYHMMKYKR